MKRLILPCLFLWAAGLAYPAESINLPIKIFNLENGLQVILAPRHETPVVHSLVRYKVGSANETTGLTGISHMLEHMMFKGTKELQTVSYEQEVPIMEKQDDLFQEVLRLRTLKAQGLAPEDVDTQIEFMLLKIKGLNLTQKIVTVQNDVDVATFQVGFSRLNADTSFDRTHYFEMFPANCLEAWAYFESSRMKEPVFREFHSERDVVLEERRQTNETQPAEILQERFLAAAFAAHPYHWGVIGWRSDIENYTRQDIINYHRLYYAPNNAIIVLVGDFQLATAQNMIRKYFGKIDRQPIAKPFAVTQEPVQKGEVRIAVRGQASPRLIIGYHRPGANHPDYPAIEMLDALLARGRNCLFYKELIKSGLAIDFQTGQWEMKRYPGLYTVTASAAEGVDLSKLETAILAVLQRLKDQPVTTRALEEARSNLTGSLLRQLRDGESLAVILAEGLDLFNNALAFNDYLDRIERLDAADLQRVAKEWFTPDNQTVAWLLPPEEEKSK